MRKLAAITRMATVAPEVTQRISDIERLLFLFS